MKRILLTTLLMALGAAACGDNGSGPVDPEAVMRERALAQANDGERPGAERETRADAASARDDDTLQADREAMVRACIEETPNDAASCECAADTIQNELDGRVYDYFAARLAGEEDRARELFGEFRLEDMETAGRAAQAVVLLCGLRLAGG